MPSITHFEIPADDPERALTFYKELFDWTIEKVPGPTDYWLIQSKDDDEPTVNGGLTKRETLQQGILTYFGVPSATEYAARVKELGGTVLKTETTVPGYGIFVICKDPEGNILALWETDKDAA
jgi:predicted enzyme related to lactoylglutathione lyase